MPLNKFFRPDSIAVVGASRQPGSVGYSIVENILKGEFSGSVYLVNPKADRILGLKCYKMLSEVIDTIDLVVIAVPARIVNQILEEDLT